MHSYKLYYQDQYIRTFNSVVQKVGKESDDRNYVVLEKTAFYPTGGGQPHDIGTLDGIKVYDVEEIEGEIRHYVDKPLEIHSSCVGEINWDRRFDHMQQHAGQHILSATFQETYGYKTISFHLGKEICSIVLKIEDLDALEAEKVEKLANQIILQNRPIETKWVTSEELSQYELRKELSVTENIRLVIIPDFDYNGCGGTHPHSTSEVSSIKILHFEKQRKNIRVYFVCGERVLKQLHEKHHIIQRLTSLLNAPQDRMEEATTRIIQQTKELEKTISELKEKLLHYEATDLISLAKRQGNQEIVKAIFHNRSISELQHLARKITIDSGNLLVLLINETEDKLQLVCARGEERNSNMNQLVKQALQLINGKGGGSNSLAQGGGERKVSAEHLMEELIRLEESLEH